MKSDKSETQRKKVLEANSLLAAIVESSDDAIIGKTLDGIILSWNYGAEKIYGYSADEVEGRSISILVPPDKTDEVPQLLQRIRQGQRIEHYETVRMRKDGKQIDISLTISPINDSTGKIIGASTIAWDITERKKAEEALKESEQRYATTLASIGDAVISTDTEGRITFMNAEAEALTGWTLAEAVTKPVTEVFNIINEYTRREADNPVTRVLQEGMIVGLANHTILVKKDGTEVPIDDSGAPIRDRDGKTMGVVLVFRDITERKQSEKALVESEERLRIAKDAAHLGIHDYNIQSGTIQWDERVRQLWGVGLDMPITYDVFISGIHPDDRIKTQAVVDQAIDPKATPVNKLTSIN